MKKTFHTIFKLSICCGVFLMSLMIGTYISHLVFVEEDLEEPAPYAFDFERN